MVETASLMPSGRATPTEEMGIRRVYTAFVFTLCLAWLIAIASQFLNDPDTFWHIRTGRDIWESGHLPVIDSYSHSYFGQPWIAKEWLAQLLLFAAHAIGGWNAVIGLAILSIAATGALSFYYLSLRLNPSLAIILTLIAVFASSQTYLARPHVLAFPIVIIWTEHVLRAAEKDEAPPLALILLMVLWANLNGSFLIGLVIAGFGFLSFLQRAKNPVPNGTVAWLVFLASSLLATAIHPYGARALTTAIGMFGAKEWLIWGEWRPVDVATDPVHEVLLLGLLAITLVAGLRLRASKAAFVVALLHLFLTHVRFAYLFYFLVPLACSYEVAQQKPNLANFFQWLKFDRAVFGTISRRSGSIVAALSLLSAAVFTYFLVASTYRPPSDIAPAAALEFARSAKISGNVLNSGEFGGYLIFEGVKTFLDGRGDQLFDDAFIGELSAGPQPNSDEALRKLSRLLERYNIAWSLLKTSDPRVSMMDRLTNFRRVFQDKDAVIHIRTD